MKYVIDRIQKDEYYVAPVMGNGNMTFQVDYEGSMYHMPNFEGIHGNMDMRIWWAARRYMHKPDFDLVSFGCFGHRINEIEHYAETAEQNLDTQNAVMYTSCLYNGGVKVDTEVFIHHDFNLIAVKKSVSDTNEFYFDYTLCDVKSEAYYPELMTITDQRITESGVDIEYKIDAGMYPYKGIISVFGNNVRECKVCGNRVSLKAGGSGEFYILFSDSVDRDDFADFAQSIKKEAMAKGFDLLKEEHSRRWKTYLSEGYAMIDDEDINRAYATAQYHLKCYTTNWSLPVGLNNGSWQGRFFAFDEFYILMGLLTSNHTSAAYKIPKFRYDGLEEALFRSSVPKNAKRGAQYPWETLENGKEGAPSGFWLDHVFHMACISCGGYYYYKFTNDKEFLKDIAYPVIKSCAVFYMHDMIYRLGDGRTVVGKCTDLERLGSYRENAYMTTCGVIKTLRIFREAAQILDCDTEFAKQCEKTAVELIKGLPNDGEKYIPYDGCTETSIGLLSGTYPFDVIERDSMLQTGGIESYLQSENRVGNMYAVGTGVCSWYMTWKAVVFARMGMKGEALKAIKSASENSGFFGEMYEIRDTATNTVYRPWFTTAAGMLIHSVNEMLLQSDENMIYIAPALPDSIENYSFKLSAYGGICIEAEVKNNRLEKLNLTFAEKCEKDVVKIKMPRNLSVSKDISFHSISINNDILTIHTSL